MTIFYPNNLQVIPWLLGLVGMSFAVGFLLQTAKPHSFLRPLAWALPLVGTFLTHRLTLQDPAGFRMLALIGALFIGMKAVVAVSDRLAGGKALSFTRWVLFAAAWPGMDLAPFRGQRTPRQGAGRLALQGSLCALGGVATMLLAVPFWHATHWTFAITVLFFIGSSLLVHYGFFTLAAAFWRRMGFDVAPQFKDPFPSESLSEFWGRRWNLAFRDMTACVLYAPLKGRLGQGAALLLAFALSGLLHEVAISLPVQAGFGLPLGYFLLHGMLVGFERWGMDRGLRFRGVGGRLWVYFWLIAPLPLLFHRPFLTGVIWPLIGATR